MSDKLVKRVARLGQMIPGLVLVGMMIFIPQAYSATVSLGSEVTVNSASDYNGRPIEAELRCPTGSVVTAIAYKGTEGAFLSDGTDGMTIACSALNSDGTLGAQGSFLANSDIDSNPLSLLTLQCPAGQAYTGLRSKGIADEFRSDVKDGYTTACSQVSDSGLGALTAAAAVSDIDSNTYQNTADELCPANHLLVGVQYDRFGSNPHQIPEDAQDSNSEWYCRELLVAGTSNDSDSDDDNDDDSDDGDKGLSINKTDNRDITRPGHQLTYTITVKNIGDQDIHDLKVTDTVPSNLKIVSVSDSKYSNVDGQKITWSGFTLSNDETREFKVTVNVASNLKNGTVISNTAKANSTDKDLGVSDKDTTKVQVKTTQGIIPILKGKKATPAVKATISKGGVAVPVTASTGPGAIAALALLGSGAAAAVTRKFI